MKYFKMIFSLCMLSASSFLFALPCIKGNIDTESGEYVFYRDYTFKTEAYVGFLEYDERTFSVRYYSPKPSKGSQNIEFLVTTNPEKENIGVELAGEKIITEVTADDVDVVNYLHDLVYEISERRSRLNGKNFSKEVVSAENFPQFGGDVVLHFDRKIPVFGLSSICKSDGKPLFEAVTMGRLASSADKSFSSFMGFPKAKTRNNVKKYEEKRALKAENDRQSLLLDESWDPRLNNLWVLDDSALIVLDTVNADASSFESKTYSYIDFLEKNLILNSNGSWVDLKGINAKKVKKEVSVNALCYMPDGTCMRKFQQIKEISKGKYAYFSLSIYEQDYQKNKAYFDRIISSISVK